MKRNPFFPRWIAGLLAVAALGAAPVAQARPEASISIALPGPPGFFGPPVLLPPPVVLREPGWRAPRRADFEFEREYDRRRAEWQRRDWERREWQRRDWERRDWERRDWERREWQRRDWGRRHHDEDHRPGRGWD